MRQPLWMSRAGGLRRIVDGLQGCGGMDEDGVEEVESESNCAGLGAGGSEQPIWAVITCVCTARSCGRREFGGDAAATQTGSSTSSAFLSSARVPSPRAMAAG